MTCLFPEDQKVKAKVSEMAQRGAHLNRETFSCSICLELLKQPVALPCGHSYCMRCISDVWDGEKEKVYSCPQCKQTFPVRPVLVKNTMLAELVEKLKTSTDQEDSADQVYAQAEDVTCDFCIGTKLKASKSCLVCMASYCQQHLQPHYQSAVFKKHKLVEPSKNLQENFCSQHDEVMTMFCRSDRQCICYRCPVDNHKGHETVSAATEWTDKQGVVDKSRAELKENIQDRENCVLLLQQETEVINSSSDQTLENVDMIFSELIRLIQVISSNLIKEVRAKQEAEVSRVRVLKEKLEQEITDLKRRDAELQQLSLTEDPVQFLLKYTSLSPFSVPPQTAITQTGPLRYFEEVTAAVLELRDHLQSNLGMSWTNVSLALEKVDVLLSPSEPVTRAGFLKYSQKITWNPNSAPLGLTLSEENQKVTLYIQQPDSQRLTLGSITAFYRVLSRDSLTCRCYWEVECKGNRVKVGVTYSYSGRYRCKLGDDNNSWCLLWSEKGYSYSNNNSHVTVQGPQSNKVGVYVDRTTGLLAFYSVSDNMALLHKVNTTFTHPLYAAVEFDSGSNSGSSVVFCQLS